MTAIKKRIAINSVTNIVSHFLRMFISIFLTPFLLHRLGAEVYGIMPLVNSCAAYLVLVSGGIQGSVGRYVTLSIAKGEFEEANTYLNTAFAILSGIIAIALIPFTFLVIYFPTLFEVPVGHETEARLVMLMLGINLLVGILFSPLSIGIYAKQRFDLRNFVTLSGQIVSTCLIVFAFVYIEANIMYLAGATLFVTLVSIIVRVAISKRLVPTLKVSMRLFDRSKLKDIGSFSFWVVVSQISVLLFLNTDYIIINKLIGSAFVTEYSLAARWNEILRAVITAAVTVVAPLSTHLEASNDFEKLKILLIRGIRIVLIMVIPPSFLLGIFSKELIVTWVGAEYLGAAPAFLVLLLPQFMILAAMPANTILTGMGRIKWIAIVTLISATLNLCFSITLVVYFKMGILGVALGTSIVLSVKNLIYTPLYVTHIIRTTASNYYTEFFRPVLSSLPMIGLALFLRNRFELFGWIPLLSSSATCVLIFLVTSYFLVFKDADREDLRMVLVKFGLIK